MKKVQSPAAQAQAPRRPWRIPALKRLTAGAAEAHVGFTTEGGFSS